MGFLKNVTDSMGRAAGFVVEQNHRAALANRLKIVIRNEKEVQARAYIELGKYYYQNLRDPENPQAERLCTAVENSGSRLKRAFEKLDELVAPAGFPGEADGEADVYDPEAADAAGPDSFLTSAEPDEPSKEEDDEFFRPFSEAKDKNGCCCPPDEEAADDGIHEVP